MSTQNSTNFDIKNGGALWSAVVITKKSNRWGMRGRYWSENT